MDPVAAFSLAGTVLQFVDTLTRFTALAHRLYQPGVEATAEHSELLTITENLQFVLPKLQDGTDTSDVEKSLAQLARDCGATATQLLGKLQQVKVAKTGRKRDAIRAAFRVSMKESDIRSLRERLDSFRSQLNLHLLLSIRQHVSRSAEQQAENLEKLGIVRSETEKLGGIATSILQYLNLRRQELDNNAEDIRVLRDDLVSTISDTASDDQVLSTVQPVTMQLSEHDCQRAQSRFLSYLQFENMTDREGRVATAHESTFRWVFEDISSKRSPQVAWSSMRQWLESNDKLYWITGKAGSGKSTLMKFLCQTTGPSGQYTNKGEDTAGFQSRCQPYLEKWAGTHSLVTASFYFWNSGVEIQMTQTGLLRTLLYQILRQCPHIMPSVSPMYWEAICLFDHAPTFLSTKELQHMLFQALHYLRPNTKICLFIDGLDEFDGNHEDLVNLVRSLLESNENIKVCVASRPWNVFQEAFERTSNLRLEDVTYNDIKVFVESRFREDVEFESLRQRYPSFADDLMNNIVKKASGVFLWVDLVVKSLLTGMRLGDRIEDFQRRLDELPPDLEQLYEKILHSLDKFYLTHAAQYFSLVETARAPLTIMQFHFADEESPDSAVRMKIRSLTEEDDVALQIEAVTRRLNSRCKGFLEVERRIQGMPSPDNGPTLRPSDLTVQYLHRTVHDFIKSPRAQAFLNASAKTRFDPCLQLCLAYLMDIKRNVGNDFGKLHSFQGLNQCLKQAAGIRGKHEGCSHHTARRLEDSD